MRLSTRLIEIISPVPTIASQLRIIRDLSYRGGNPACPRPIGTGVGGMGVSCHWLAYIAVEKPTSEYLSIRTHCGAIGRKTSQLYPQFGLRWSATGLVAECSS